MAWFHHIRYTAKWVLGRRHLSTPAQVQKSVFISQSRDVYSNLALEQWLQANIDTSKHHVMLYTRNDPCIILGEKDNPWTGSNVSAHPDVDDHKTVAVARRCCNAKLQYQDGGSINLTFFGPQSSKYNLSIITRAVFRKYGLNLDQTDDNLSFYNMQVSESATTVQKGTVYENITLSFDVNKTNWQRVMRKNNTSSNETFLNISDLHPCITHDGLLSAIGWEFLRTHAHELKDGGAKMATAQRGFQLINPSEGWLPGISDIRSSLASWEWCFGKTPKFSIYHTFQVPLELLINAVDANELRVKIDVDHGRITDISLVVPPGLLTSGFTGRAQILIDVRDHKFSADALSKVEHYLGLDQCCNVQEKFVTECVRKAMVI